MWHIARAIYSKTCKAVDRGITVTCYGRGGGPVVVYARSRRFITTVSITPIIAEKYLCFLLQCGKALTLHTLIILRHQALHLGE